MKGQEFSWWTEHLRARQGLLPAAPKSTDPGLIQQILGTSQNVWWNCQGPRALKEPEGKENQGSIITLKSTHHPRRCAQSCHCTHCGVPDEGDLGRKGFIYFTALESEKSNGVVQALGRAPGLHHIMVAGDGGRGKFMSQARKPRAGNGRASSFFISLTRRLQESHENYHPRAHPHSLPLPATTPLGPQAFNTQTVGVGRLNQGSPQTQATLAPTSQMGTSRLKKGQ